MLVREALNKLLADLPLLGAPKPEARPIWEVLQDNIKHVAAEEFAKLPKDGACEHGHYLLWAS
jgi:hypothetical protein